MLGSCRSRATFKSLKRYLGRRLPTSEVAVCRWYVPRENASGVSTAGLGHFEETTVKDVKVVKVAPKIVRPTHEQL